MLCYLSHGDFQRSESRADNINWQLAGCCPTKRQKRFRQVLVSTLTESLT
jgi:hypothetical protein